VVSSDQGAAYATVCEDLANSARARLSTNSGTKSRTGD
jgi:hypothetical protein